MVRQLRPARFFRRFPMTATILVVTVASFFVELALGGSTDPTVHLRMGALRGDRVVEHGEIYRLVMPMLVHYGPIHLALNLLAFVQLGLLVETLWGARRMLLFYVVSGIVASLASAALSGPGYGGSVGASGAILGLAGVLIGATVTGREPSRTWLRNLLGTRLLAGVALTFALGVGLGFVSPVIDNWAHLGGFVTGVLLAVAHPDPTEREVVASSVGGAFSLALVVVAIGFTAADGGRAVASIDIDNARLLAVRVSSGDATDPSRLAELRTATTLLQMLAFYDRAGAASEGIDVFVRQVDRLTHPFVLAYLAGSAASLALDPTAERAVDERWVRVAPDDPHALNALAWNLVTTGDPLLRDPTRAESLARRSLALLGSPADVGDRQARAAFLDTLAEALYQLGRFDEAREVQRESVALARETGMDEKVLAEMQDRLIRIEAAGAG